MILRALGLTAGFLLGTALFGWWSVPVLGLAWGIATRKTAWASLMAGCSAMVAWGLLLAWSAALGPVGILVTKLGSVAQVPGVFFVVGTLLLPFLLAAFAAAVPLSMKGREPALSRHTERKRGWGERGQG